MIECQKCGNALWTMKIKSNKFLCPRCNAPLDIETVKRWLKMRDDEVR